ncbi:hypothetical protein JOM56_005337 [Amanita muscaria]
MSSPGHTETEETASNRVKRTDYRKPFSTRFQPEPLSVQLAKNSKASPMSYVSILSPQNTSNKFNKGRKSLNVVAVCLYVACRQKRQETI